MRELQQTQTKDYIARVIRNEILSGHVEPGEELGQVELAEMLGVSRMPVREALQTLVQEGFARRLPNRHIQAVVLDEEQIFQVFRMLAAVGTQMAEQAMDVQAPADGLAECANALERAAGQQEAIRWEKEFHRQLGELSGNPYLEQLYGRVLEGYTAYVIENMEDKGAVAEELKAVARACQEGDREGLREHFDRYCRLCAEWFKRRRKT